MKIPHYHDKDRTFKRLPSFRISVIYRRMCDKTLQSGRILDTINPRKPNKEIHILVPFHGARREPCCTLNFIYVNKIVLLEEYGNKPERYYTRMEILQKDPKEKLSAPKEHDSVFLKRPSIFVSNT